MKRRALMAVASAQSLVACIGTPAPAIRWYQLRGEPPLPWRPGAGDGEVWVLTTSVALAGALDRDTLMVEIGAAGLEPLEGHRWAEPLRDSVPRLLLQDLRRLRGEGRVWAAPAPPGVTPVRRLRVELLALQARADRSRLHLHGRWWLGEVGTVRPDGAPAALPQLGEADFEVPVADASPDALAAAHRLALWRLAEHIAGQVSSTSGRR